MKTIKSLIILLLAVTLTTSAQKSEINILKSVVKWTGSKIGGSHNGEIKIKSGNLELKDGDIVGGIIEIDMNTITNIDLSDPSYNQKLIKHLKSDDFFGVEKFPVSTFKITKADKFINNKAKVSGILTIKGKSENISFEVVKENNIYTAQIKVDRSKFDVRYGSNSFFDNLGDSAIDDIFILDIRLLLK